MHSCYCWKTLLILFNQGDLEIFGLEMWEILDFEYFYYWNFN
jgi:hypothetical protein